MVQMWLRYPHCLGRYMADHGLMDKSEEELAKLNFSILGLSGSYHGDTLGALDAQSPSVFTG